MRYVLKIAYDGTNYSGWQIQNNAPSVQEEVTKSLELMLKAKVNLTASGRTDSGVHALAQVCHFDGETTVPPEKIADVLNVTLPKDISVLASAKAPENFDANRSAKKKTYRYSLYFSSRRNPLLDRYSLFIKGEVDIEKLKSCAKVFEGKHNFKAYCASGSQVKTFEREILEVKVERIVESKNTSIQTQNSVGEERVDILVTGTGFLYNMVRTMVGTMLSYMNGQKTIEEVEASLRTGDRNLVGKTLPANGLTLLSVEYAEKLF